MVNEWTRGDLPDPVILAGLIEGMKGATFTQSAVIVDAVVEHLNANGGVPASREDAALADRLERQAATIGELQGSFLRVERDAARWRRAYEIVEGERDLARERLREVENDRAAMVREWQEMHASAEKAERERDEWQARAEAAEAKIKPGSPLNQQAESWRRIITHPAINPSLRECGRSYSDLAFDRVTWLFEAAEARTAVTRDDIEKAIRGKVWAANREPNKAGFHRVHVDWATDAIHALVAGDDPAVLVVRESEVAAVEVVQGGNWRAGTTGIPLKWTAQKVREMRDDYASEWVECEAIARAIEAEPADPVEVKAAELYGHVYGTRFEDGSSGVQAEYRKVAAHVLGQETK